MKVLAIFLIAIVSLSSATSMLDKYPGAFTFKKRSIMKVMSLVEEQLKTNGPLDAITRILDEFEQEIHAEQLAHDQLYARQTAECEDEFQFRQGEIAEAQAALSEANETLSGCQQQLVRAKQDLAITKQQIKENTATLINVHTTRRRDKYAFDTFIGKFQLLIPALDDGLEYIQAIFAGEGSFVQIAKHSNKLLVSAAQVKMAAHLGPIITTLAELASGDVQADTALLNKLIGLFEAFKAKLQAEHGEKVQAEEAAIVAYNAEVARLEALIAALEQQQEELEFEIAELNKCIITQQNIIAAATLKEERNQRLYDDAIKMCHAMDVQYASAKAGRAAELELLAAISVKVEEHFANLSAGVVERGELDNFDNTYSNASAYEEGAYTQ